MGARVSKGRGRAEMQEEERAARAMAKLTSFMVIVVCGRATRVVDLPKASAKYSYYLKKRRAKKRGR